MMRAGSAVLSLALFVAVPAFAQDTPKVEVSGGYQYLAAKQKGDDKFEKFKKGWYADVAGNVSQVAPADYIGFPVSETEISGHSHVMREASITDLAHRNAMITAEVLATVATRIATDPATRTALQA